MGKFRDDNYNTLGAVMSSLSGYSPQQIKDIRENKIVLNALGEPVYTGTNDAAKPKAKANPFLTTLALDRDYGKNPETDIQPLGSRMTGAEYSAYHKAKVIAELNAQVNGLKTGGKAAQDVVRSISPTSGAGAAGRMALGAIYKMFTK